jgi:tetratricopeptide (TPR) repeat protein
MSKEIILKLNEIAKSKNFKLLERECDLLLSDYPTHIHILQLLGLACINLDKFDKAEKYLLKTVNIEPKNLSANFNLARFYQSRKNYEYAKEYYLTSLKLSQNNSQILNEFAEFLISTAKLDEAEILLLDATSTIKNNEFFYFNLGIIYLKKNDFLTALNFLNQAEAINKANYLVKSNILFLLSKLERTKSIIEHCLRYIKNHPNFIEGYTYLINAYIVQGNKDDATKYLQDAIKLAPNHPELIRQHSLLLHVNENSSFVASIINQFSQSDDIKSQITYGYALSKIFEDNKNYKEAASWINKSNNLKKKIYSNYNLELHLQQFEELSYFFKKNFKLFKPNLNKHNVQPIFIVGLPRSGSTLIEQILSAHSKVADFGEKPFFSDSVNNYIQAEDTDTFCKIIAKSDVRLFEQIADLYMQKIKLLHMDNKNFVTDKMLLNFKLIPLIKLCFPKAKIINCTRDAKDNCTSLLKTNFEGYLPWTYDENSIVRFYKKYLQIMAVYSDLLTNDIYHAVYDQIVAHPKDQIQKLLNFCDLAEEDSCFEFYNNKRDVNTASVLQVRKKIYNNSIGYWKNFEPYFPNMYQNLESL